MRQAIEASLAEARERGEKVDDVPVAVPPSTAVHPDVPHGGDMPDNDLDEDEQGPNYDLLADQRHDDDEDAALQAALSASLVDAGVVGLKLPAGNLSGERPRYKTHLHPRRSIQRMMRQRWWRLRKRKSRRRSTMMTRTSLWWKS
jgi:hypothetical protein